MPVLIRQLVFRLCIPVIGGMWSAYSTRPSAETTGSSRLESLAARASEKSAPPGAANFSGDRINLCRGTNCANTANVSNIACLTCE